MEQVRSFITGHVSTWRWGVLLAFGVLLIGWLLNTPEGLLGKADAVGYAVCHRIDLRSFHLGDRALPLCARCTGMYLGALVGLMYQGVLGRRRAGMPGKLVIMLLILLAGFFIVDGGNSFLALILGHGVLYQPNNILRLFSGTGMGLVIASALLPAFNQTMWIDWSEKPLISGLQSFLGMGILSVVIDVLVLSGISWVLYPLALLSAAGVLVLLSVLYSMVLVIAFRKENYFNRAYELLFPLVAGFGVGLLQIAVIDFLRFVITGTWDGFHFG